jgi:hypothetical protein
MYAYSRQSFAGFENLNGFLGGDIANRFVVSE